MSQKVLDIQKIRLIIGYSLQPTAYSLQPTAYSLQPTAYSLQVARYASLPTLLRKVALKPTLAARTHKTA